MNTELMSKIEGWLQNTLLRYYSDTSINMFDEFIKFCQEYYDSPAHSISEIKLKTNTKLKGDIFEYFVLRYFKNVYQTRDKTSLINVWLLKDVPQTILDHLKLNRNDLGIDLIAETTEGKYLAIQAKYRIVRL